MKRILSAAKMIVGEKRYGLAASTVEAVECLKSGFRALSTIMEAIDMELGQEGHVEDNFYYSYYRMNS